MLKRTITGVFITLCIYLTIYFSYNPAVILSAAALLSVLGTYEVCRATGTHKNHFFLIATMLIAGAISYAPISNYSLLITILFPISILMFAIMMCRIDKCSFSNAISVFPVIAVVALLYKSIPELRNSENGIYYLAFAITACLVTDITAYLVGKAIGKHRLIPKISPQKTIEGSVGAVILTGIIMLLCGVGINNIANINVNYSVLILYSVLVSAVAQFGDLSMSVIKRITGIKDFGNIFPGHGGILDRFDSHMFAIPFTIVFCSLGGSFFI